jgi:hypothetical protein
MRAPIARASSVSDASHDGRLVDLTKNSSSSPTDGSGQLAKDANVSIHGALNWCQLMAVRMESSAVVPWAAAVSR